MHIYHPLVLGKRTLQDPRPDRPIKQCTRDPTHHVQILQGNPFDWACAVLMMYVHEASTGCLVLHRDWDWHNLLSNLNLLGPEPKWHRT